MKRKSKRIIKGDKINGDGALKKHKYVLRLYVAGITPQSSRAIENITRYVRKILKADATFR